MPHLVSLLRNAFIAFKNRLSPVQREEALPAASPTPLLPTIGAVTPSPSPLHAPLVAALGAFAQSQLSIGRVMFHGCSATAPHINVAGKCLNGTRKWFSSDATYAIGFGRQHGIANGNGLLWVCCVKEVIPALVGSQSSLMAYNPWTLAAFPKMLPDEFERYAGAVMNLNGPVALLDFPQMIGHREILVSSPQFVIEVLHVRSIPSGQEKQIALREGLMPCMHMRAGEVLRKR